MLKPSTRMLLTAFAHRRALIERNGTRQPSLIKHVLYMQKDSHRKYGTKKIVQWLTYGCYEEINPQATVVS